MEIDKSTAITIATRFFEQHHSGVYAKDAVLEDNVWTVTVDIGIMDKKIRQVSIDVNNGKILSYA